MANTAAVARAAQLFRGENGKGPAAMTRQRRGEIEARENGRWIQPVPFIFSQLLNKSHSPKMIMIDKSFYKPYVHDNIRASFLFRLLQETLSDKISTRST